jgi:hypothetical protein
LLFVLHWLTCPLLFPESPGYPCDTHPHGQAREGNSRNPLTAVKSMT